MGRIKTHCRLPLADALQSTIAAQQEAYDAKQSFMGGLWQRWPAFACCRQILGAARAGPLCMSISGSGGSDVFRSIEWNFKNGILTL